MTQEDIRAVDVSDMFSLIRDFPAQVREAAAIGKRFHPPFRARGIANIVMTGLGGSAIGGDLLRSYLAGELDVPFMVNRHYVLPRFVGPKSLVIVSSYSGNTEETIAAHREATRRKARVLCISSGGMTGSLALRAKQPLITIPGGLPPRAALGYSFFPLLVALGRIGLIKSRPRDIAETVSLLEAKSAELAVLDPAKNPALRLAEQLQGRIGIVYASTERFDAVATRWRGQMAENAKSLMFGHVLPDMNHNELVGWKALTSPMREMQVIFLRDHADHPRVQMRFEFTHRTIARMTDHLAEVWSEGTSLLARMFSLVYLGDWTSYYLAILHREDPTPVAVIDQLKAELGKA